MSIPSRYLRRMVPTMSLADGAGLWRSDGSCDEPNPSAGEPDETVVNEDENVEPAAQGRVALGQALCLRS
jgi:hypothetical protein